MMPKKLSDLLNCLPVDSIIAVHGNKNAKISAPIAESTLDLQRGGIFIARQGLITDGHKYIRQAIEKGAAAIVGQQNIQDLPVPYVQVRDSQKAIGLLAAAYHDFPSRKMIVTGVTGTDGKTTTSAFLQSIMNIATNGKTGYISTIAADLGDATADTGFHVTTPGAPQVQQYLKQMVVNGSTHCVLEMTSHGLAQGRLNGVDIDIAVITNVAHEHLDYHGTWENYRNAKAIMFQMLSKSHSKPNQTKNSVISADDPSFDFFAVIPADKHLSYSITALSDFQATNIEYHSDGTHFQVNGQKYTVNLIGDFNVLNALAAITVAASLGIDAETIREGIAAVKSLSGRMERIDEGQDFTAIVDFAHTPNALKNALEACRPMLGENGRLIAIFGSAGLRDVEKRRMMAETSAQLADFTVLTAEDPRTELLDDILQMMADGCISQGGIENETFIRVPDRGEAIYKACQMAKSGDIVIACGKGHEQSMCFGTVEHLWDDRDAMRSALHGKPLKTLPTST